MWTVRVVAGPDELLGKELRVEAGGPLLIGRADDCALPLHDQSMSRRHASVEALAEGLRVADNGSANGVVVDGVRVPQAVLGGGGRFTLGTTTLEVIAEESADPVASPEAPSIDRTMAISDIADLVAQFEKPSALEELGEPLVMTANKPMVLSDPEAFFLVVSGKVELFTVQLEGGEPRGARTHFLTADSGHAFFGMDTDRYGMGNGFLAVGKAGSRLVRFSLARLMSLSAVEAHGERIATLIAGWVEGLSRRLTKDVPSPSADLALVPGTPAELAPGKTVMPERAPVWIEMPAARFLFDGMASLSWEVEGVLFPLAQGSWIEVLEEHDVALAPRSTQQAVADPRLWAGLEAFHRVLCECEFLNKKLAVVDEYNRLQKKADQVEEAREVAYNAIGSVLGGTGVWERPAAGSTDLEPVFRACLLIGKQLGVAVRNHPDTKQQRNFEEQVLAVAQTSRIRTRKVALAGEWWTRDSGPLLGQYEATKAPVAILPTSPKSYEAVDPASGQKRKLDAALAKQLEPFAYTFYRGFGDGVVTAKEMLRFGVRGLGREFRSVALMGIGLGVLGMLTPMITGRVFDTAIPQAERSVLMQFALGLFLVALTQSAFKITQSVAMLRVQGKMDYSVQAAVWDRLLELPMTFYRKFSSGDLAERAAGVDQMRSIIAGAGVAAILGSLSSVFNVFQMASYNFKLAAVGIGLSLAYVTLTTTANWVKLRFQRDEQRRRGRITGLVLQLISGVAKLRVVGAENHAFRVWATEFAEQRKVTFRVGRVKNLMAVLNASFPVISSMAIFLTMMSLKEAAAKEGSSFDPHHRRLPRLQRRLRRLPGGHAGARRRLALDAAHRTDLGAPDADRADAARDRRQQGVSRQAQGRARAVARLLPLLRGRAVDPPGRLAEDQTGRVRGPGRRLGLRQVDAAAPHARLRETGQGRPVLRRPGSRQSRRAHGALAARRRAAGQPAAAHRHLPQHRRHLVAHRAGGLGGRRRWPASPRTSRRCRWACTPTSPRAAADCRAARNSA